MPREPWQRSHEDDEDRPDLARTADEVRAYIERLELIEDHRDWRVGELEAHVANIEEARAIAQARVEQLEKHAEQLEERAEELDRHVHNQQERLDERRARLLELETHVSGLERRLGRRPARLGRDSMFASVDSVPLSALFRAGERIWKERQDLQRRFPRDRAADFWYWLMWNGPDLDAEVEGCLYPQPEPHLIARVVGEETSPRQYFRSGLVNWWMMDGYLREAGFDPVRGGDVLDFGVGCGRILQFFALYSPASRFVGADVDDQAVAWCADHLDFANVEALPSEPPCGLADASFDAIYSYSVFSHLPEDLHRAWLEELARICRPGAAVVVTVQGRHVVDEIVGGRRPGFHPAPKALERRVAELQKKGFAFFPYDRLHFGDPENVAHFDDWDLERYGSTFILEPYVRQKWTDLFDLVAYHESPDEWQDYVVLKRRG